MLNKTRCKQLKSRSKHTGKGIDLLLKQSMMLCGAEAQLDSLLGFSWPAEDPCQAVRVDDAVCTKPKKDFDVPLYNLEPVLSLESDVTPDGRSQSSNTCTSYTNTTLTGGMSQLVPMGSFTWEPENKSKSEKDNKSVSGRTLQESVTQPIPPTNDNESVSMATGHDSAYNHIIHPPHIRTKRTLHRRKSSDVPMEYWYAVNGGIQNLIDILHTLEALEESKTNSPNINTMENHQESKTDGN